MLESTLSRSSRGFFLALSLAICSGSTFAASDKSQTAPADALSRMHDRYKSVTSLAAEFTQRLTNVALGTTKETKGHIFIKRPNFFRWQTEAPQTDSSTLVSDGKKVWYYKPPVADGQNGQVYIRDAADVQSQLAIDLLVGQSNLKKDFKTKLLEADHYELKPLKPAGDVERIELFLEKPTKLVYRLILFTMTGNQTELELKRVNLAANLSEDLFHFKTPPKTEEIY